MNALLVAGIVMAVPPVRRAVVKPVAKLAVKGGLTVVDTATGAVKGVGDVYAEAKDEHRGVGRVSADGRGRAKAAAGR